VLIPVEEEADGRALIPKNALGWPILAGLFFAGVSARLKPCPDERRAGQAPPLQLGFFKGGHSRAPFLISNFEFQFQGRDGQGRVGEACRSSSPWVSPNFFIL
jgi:hypothetical protein